ncbi:endonuclease V [Candidatus Woesearchaeota archaeon]|nr:endonuclease V [Candidatus Woesearchaeota archaeon]
MDLHKLKKEQILLSESVILKDKISKIRLVAGVDQSYIGNNTIISAIVVCEYPSMKIVEKKYAVKEDVKFPYIPGFIAYREAPIIIGAFEKLQNKPDILMCNFHGTLHPRKCGAASHIGVALNVPTIGIAKKLMVGKEKEGQIFIDSKLKGIALRTKEHAKPIYISPGHMITLTTSVKTVSKCLRDHKLPEPLYLAHRYAVKIKKKQKEKDSKLTEASSMKKIEA